MKVPPFVAGRPVVSIGRRAFRGDTRLTAIEIPPSVESLGVEAFSGCTALKRVNLPADLRTISARAFSGCVALRIARLPFSLTRIGPRAFAGCVSLEELPHFVRTGPKDDARVVRSIVESSFPIALKSIGEAAFEGCTALRTVVIPHRVTRINASVFDGCTSLHTVWLHSSLSRIDTRAFRGCESLHRLHLPASVESIGEEALRSQTLIVCAEDTYAHQFARNNGNPVRHGKLPAEPIGSHLGADGGLTVADVLDDREMLEGLLDLYEVRPPTAEAVRDEHTADTFAAPTPRFRFADGAYRAEQASDEDSDVTIAMVGDIMCGFRQQRKALSDGSFDFRPGFEFVKPILSDVDLAVGNLESMIASAYPYMHEQLYVDDRPNLNAPPAFLSAVRDAGFDAVTNAQNHMYDTGTKGILQTLDALNRANLIHGGLRASAQERRYLLFELKGMRIAIVAYLDPARQRMKQLNFTSVGLSAMASPFDEEEIRADITAARNSGAEFVVACAHWGKEYTDEISSVQADYATMLVEAGADYVFGSHSHCPQRYTVLQSSDGRRVPVVYSGGNFLSDIQRKRPITQDTFIGTLTLTRSEDGNVIIKGDGYVPCRIVERDNHGGSVSVVPCELLLEGALGYSSVRAREDLRRIADAMGDQYAQIRIDGLRDPQAETRLLAVPAQTKSEPMRSPAEHAPMIANDYGDSPLKNLSKEPLQSALIETEALAYGLSVTRFSTTLFTAQDPEGHLMGFRRAASTLSSMVGGEFCADKAVCKALLRAHEIPTALGFGCRSAATSPPRDSSNNTAGLSSSSH
ncbi:CapA family protein [Microbacterium sp. NIBRBAC000506063]|uniref:CapA family protein n=1 Tax=Microbacterium sp. NIBRBAC000506063 TaxID=2734618 RepID=UPI001BB6FB39|nr:CapA family protein [Microbacterium sp. NIBRBAC000506063]QTV80575.1 CapA family protein [Microbacterium sp. NIBRBAC000506063]